MLLAGDVGGTKTLLGLFDRGSRRPAPRVSRMYETTAFDSLGEMLDAFAQDAGAPLRVEAAAFGVAGPVVDGRARLTNVHWEIAEPELQVRLEGARVRLLNDLEALAWSIDLLQPDEQLVLQSGEENRNASAAVIAAGTGLGQCVLLRVGGRLTPAPSEAGHADFAARTDRELELVRMLREERGRVEVEQVLSGPGLVHLHRFTHRGGECAIVENVEAPDAPSAISRAGMGGRCQGCAEALRMFVSAYGAEAGNLALRSLALGGVFIGGGIAPKILPAMRSGEFMAAFRDKPPMTDLLSRVPVHVILNSEAGLLGAAACASELAWS
jgi:glucokinase